MRATNIEIGLSLDDQLSSALSQVTLFYFLEKARKMAQDFEKEMMNANSIFLETTKNYEELTKHVVELGGQTTKSLVDVAKSLYSLASAGLDAKNSFEVLKEGVRLAEATGSEIDKVTEVVAKFARSFKIDFKNVNVITEQFANLINKTQIRFDDLSSSMKYATQIGAMFPKQGLSTILTALGELVNRGIPANMALRQLRSVFTDLSKPTAKLEKILSKYGLTIEDVSLKQNKLIDVLQTFKDVGVKAEDIMALFGKRSAGAFQILLDEGVPAFRRLQIEIEKTSTLEEQIGVQHESLANKFGLFGTALQETFIKLGEPLNRILKVFVWYGKSFLDLINKTKILSKAVSLLGTIFVTSLGVKAIGVLGTVAEKLLGLSGAFNTVIAFTSQYSLAIGAIVAAASVAIYLIEKWRKIEIDGLKQTAKYREKEYLLWEEINRIREEAIRKGNEAMKIESELRALSIRQANAVLQNNAKLYSQLAKLIEKKKEELKVATEINKSAELNNENYNNEIIAIIKLTKLYEEYLEKAHAIQKEVREGNLSFSEAKPILKEYKTHIDSIRSSLSLLGKAFDNLSLQQQKDRIFEAYFKDALTLQETIEALVEVQVKKMSIARKVIDDFAEKIVKALDVAQTEKFNDSLKNLGITTDIVRKIANKFGLDFNTVSKILQQNLDFTTIKADKLKNKMHELSLQQQRDKVFELYTNGVITLQEAIERLVEINIKGSTAMQQALENYANKFSQAFDKVKIDEYNKKIQDTVSEHKILHSVAEKFGVNYQKLLNNIEKKTESVNKVTDQTGVKIKEAFSPNNLDPFEKKLDNINNSIFETKRNLQNLTLQSVDWSGNKHYTTNSLASALNADLDIGDTVEVIGGAYGGNTHYVGGANAYAEHVSSFWRNWNMQHSYKTTQFGKNDTLFQSKPIPKDIKNIQQELEKNNVEVKKAITDFFEEIFPLFGGSSNTGFSLQDTFIKPIEKIKETINNVKNVISTQSEKMNDYTIKLAKEAGEKTGLDYKQFLNNDTIGYSINTKKEEDTGRLFTNSLIALEEEKYKKYMDSISLHITDEKLKTLKNSGIFNDNGYMKYEYGKYRNNYGRLLTDKKTVTFRDIKEGFVEMLKQLGFDIKHKFMHQSERISYVTVSVKSSKDIDMIIDGLKNIFGVHMVKVN